MRNHEPTNARHQPPDPHPSKAAGSKGPVQRAAFRLLVVVWICLLTWALITMYDPAKEAENYRCSQAAKALNYDPRTVCP